MGSVKKSHPEHSVVIFLTALFVFMLSGTASAKWGEIASCSKVRQSGTVYCFSAGLKKIADRMPVSLYTRDGQWVGGGRVIRTKDGKKLIQIEESVRTIRGGFLYEPDAEDSLTMTYAFSQL